MGAGANFNVSVMAASAAVARWRPTRVRAGIGASTIESSADEREAVAGRLREIVATTGYCWDSLWIWVLGCASVVVALEMGRMALIGAIAPSAAATVVVISTLCVVWCELWRRARNTRIMRQRRAALQGLSATERQAALDAVDQLDWVWPKEAVPEQMKGLVRELRTSSVVGAE